MSNEDPFTQRRRLRTALKNARKAASLTQQKVADELQWSSSKIIRIENGAVSVSFTDLKALLELYSVVDPKEVKELVNLAQDSRRQESRYRAYGDLLSPEAQRYIAYEGSALAVRSYEPQLVSGLLQTDEYTREILRKIEGVTDEDIDRYVEIRELRQEQLTNLGDRRMTFIHDESVIRRVVGGPGVMQRQLDHLRELARIPQIDIRIIAFGKGAYPGMRGPFVHLEFASDTDDVLYLENTRGDSIFSDTDADTAEFLATWLDIERNYAAPADDLGTYLDTAITKLPPDTDPDKAAAE